MQTLNKTRESQHDVYQWLCANETGLTERNLICLPCIKYIQRNVHKENFYPRWKPKRIEKKKCSIEDCQADLYTHTLLVSVDRLEEILQERVQGYTINDSKESIALCKEHYRRMYLHLNPLKVCESCGEKPKRNEIFNRHCPSPDIVNSIGPNKHRQEPQLARYISTVCTASPSYWYTYRR